jgi:hypothetical protein
VTPEQLSAQSSATTQDNQDDPLSAKRKQPGSPPRGLTPRPVPPVPSTPPKETKKQRTEVLLSPTSKKLKALWPRLSKSVLEARRNGEILEWTNENGTQLSTMRSTNHIGKTELLETVMACISDLDSATAAIILLKLLKRPSMKATLDFVAQDLTREAGAVDKVIVTRLSTFIKHHTTPGARPKPAQDSLDAILTAAMFPTGVDSIDRMSATAVGNRLGVKTHAKLKDCSTKATKMVQEKTTFEPTLRKVREDKLRDKAQIAIHKFCHSEQGSNVDTESYRVINLPDYENGGLLSPHAQRTWHDTGVVNRYEAFKRSDHYEWFKDQYPKDWQNISKEVFRLEVCPCVKDPGPESCVDLRMHALKCYMDAVRTASLYNPEVKEAIKACSCPLHANRTDEFETGVPIASLLAGRTANLIEATCCEAKAEIPLCHEIGGKAPRVIPWSCTNPSHGPDKCTNCGVMNRLKLDQCDVYKNLSTPVKVMEWKLAPRAGMKKDEKQNTQIELSESELPFNVVVQRLAEQLEICRPHYACIQWLRINKYIDINTFGDDTCVVFTDFGATLDLKSAHTDNCSQNAHAVLDNFVVLHRRRVVAVDKDGTQLSVVINDCDVFHYFGDTISKGKKNDWIFHNACLEDIVKHYKSENAKLKHVIVWTDNCAGQYKCRFNFLKIAQFPSQIEGVLLHHRFAQKYDFKGIWDASSKVIKDFIRKNEYEATTLSPSDQTEKKNKRYPNALACYKQLREHLPKPTPKKDWDTFEKTKNTKILEKGHFVINNRFFGYGTEKKQEFDELIDAGYDHIVFTDRLNVPWAATVKDTLQLHSVEGRWLQPKRVSKRGSEVDEWSLKLGTMPCACVSCRIGSSVIEECSYKHITNFREAMIHQGKKPAGDGNPRVTADDQKIYNELTALLQLPTNTCLSVRILTNQLTFYKLPLPSKGKKSDQARRLLTHLKTIGYSAQTGAERLPLVCTFIDNDEDLEEEEEEDT